MDDAMLRLCASFAAAVRGNERAALEADMGLMNVDAEDMEAVSGRREDITATEKESFVDAQSRYRIGRSRLSHVHATEEMTTAGFNRWRSVGGRVSGVEF